jgi:hypothetical protein
LIRLARPKKQLKALDPYPVTPNYTVLTAIMSLAQETITSNTITLKGSTAIVKEFFHYSVNSILYQRGVYPPDSFKRMNAYNLSMMVTVNEALIVYMNNILRQLEGLA